MVFTIDGLREDMESRKRELEPLVQEYRALSAAQEALMAVEHRPAGGRKPGKPKRRSAAKAAAAKARKGTGKRGRPKGSGKRTAQVLDLLERMDDPLVGMTIPELAGAMGIQPNYLYRVMSGLEADRKVRRGTGKRWVVTRRRS